MMLAPVITYPDAVALALPYLRTSFANDTYTDVYANIYEASSVIVAASVPRLRPATFVVLRRAGGTDRVHSIFDLPRLDAQIWAGTDFEAIALGQLIRAYLLAAPGRVTGVSRATTFLGPTNIPDDASGSPRCLLSVEWQIHGTPL